MRAAPADLYSAIDLYPGETILWTGPATSLPARISIPYLICLGFLFVLYSATRHSPPDFERDASASYSTFYWLLPILLVLFSGSLLFRVAERLLLSSGRAHAFALLTDRRLISVADWPWRRVWAVEYRVNPLHMASPGVLRHGRYFVIALSRKDADTVLELITNQGAIHR